MPKDLNPDTNFKIIDTRPPDTQARMTGDHFPDVKKMISAESGKDYLPVLKSCPFCGGEAEKVTFERMNETFVRCKSCGVCTKMDNSQGDVAIDAWNRRTPGPGTSVITWYRYDGTPETLPEEDRTVIIKTQKLITVGDRSMGSWFVVGNTFVDNPVELPCKKGDLWAYLPEPPREMECMRRGWMCPVCGSVYAPSVPECGNCNNKEADA